ncbi:MAG: NAD(P)-dependent oxidoreductase [Dehalococcoidales bacterium]|nr:NAD(P)-dependent oxidoreductase [Dehalococcoidales bacterium]
MIIVTGATGLIGTYLIDQLVKDGVEVLATGKSGIGEAYYKNQDIPFQNLDITQETDFRKLPQRNISAVVHLAALIPANVIEEDYDPRHYITVNVVGTLNVLEFCRRNSVHKIIYSSSHSDVENLWGFGKPIGEEAGSNFKYTGDHAMYIISKLCGVDCVRHYYEQYGVRNIVFRLPPVYGYGPHTEIYKDGKSLKTGFVIFIENAVDGKPIEVWGDCQKGRDVVYVKDVVSAIILALKSEDALGLYNIASGKVVTLKEEAESIVRVFSPKETPSRIVYRPDKPNSIQPFLYDISKARRDFGWFPKYSFEQMLEDYKKEAESGRFTFLLEKRKEINRK